MTNTFTAVCILIGTLIGAGFLAIPYVVMQSGFIIGLLTIIVIAIIMIVVMLYLGEITLRTKQQHNLIGYAEHYLGPKGKKWMFFSFVWGVYAALLAYMIAEGQSLSFLFFGTTDYAFILALVFWLALSCMTAAGTNILKKSESLGVVLVLIIVFSLVLLKSPDINLSNLSYVNLEHFLAPLGVVIFAFLGYSIVPELRRMLGRNGRYLKRSIIISYIIVALVYAVFAALVLGFKGQGTPQIATLVLGKPFILLGVLTIFNASLALSNAMIDTFKIDFKKTRKQAWFYTMLLPLVVYALLSIKNSLDFITIISIGGIISGGITLVLILFMIPRAKIYGNRTPEFSIPYSKKFVWLVSVILIIALISEIVLILS